MGICVNTNHAASKIQPSHMKAQLPKSGTSSPPAPVAEQRQKEAVNTPNKLSEQKRPSIKQLNEPSLENTSDKKSQPKDRKVKKFNFREQVKYEEVKFVENYKKVERQMSSSDIIFILNMLKKCNAFKDLLDEDFEEIIPNMSYGVTKAGEYIFKQNEPATCFFIIQEGICEVEIDGAAKKTLSKGQSFGELALLYNAPRSASIKAVTDAGFWTLDRFSFRAIVDKISFQNYESNRSYLDRIKFFEAFSSQQKNNLASYIIIEKYQPDEPIVNKGDMANSYYVIKEGTVECWDDTRFIRELGEGDSFGEQALYASSTRALSVRAKTRTTCLVFSRETLIKVLGGDVESIINKNTALWAIERNDIFKQLNAIQKLKWINSSEIVKIETRQEIGERNHMPWFLYIVLEGNLVYGKETISKGEIFGLDFLYPKDTRQMVLRDKLFAEKGRYAQLSIQQFLEIVEGDLETCIHRNTVAEQKKTNEMTRNFREAVANLELSDLLYIKKLGEGQFGDVMLVFDSKLGALYALKMILKTKIVENMIEKHVVNEKKVLQSLNFPFIMKLFKTYKDDKAVYFLTSFVRGMEMFDMIRQVDLLDNEETRFYIGTLMLTLEYLHGIGIVYRDLKPENMIVDELGYLNLIDFGTAKRLIETRGRTQTIIGTPHYMAPETLQGKGYSYAVDLWSLGILMYEFMCGCVPFGEEEVDPINIYNLIIKSSLEYPLYFVVPQNSKAMSLINILLNRIPEARMNGDYANLKSHNWFNGFNWDNLFERKIEAPYIPSSDHVISDSEIRKIVQKKISALSEIEVF